MRAKPFLSVVLILAACSSDPDKKPEETEIDEGKATPEDDEPSSPSGSKDAGPTQRTRDASTSMARDAGSPTQQEPETPEADDDAGTSAPDEPSSGGSSCLLGTSTDYRANGPYTVKNKMVDLGGELGPYTIYYPDALDADCPAPIVAWGNGTGVTGPGVYAHFFRHAASWGIVTIAAHNSNAQSKPFLAGGIDYLLAQNADSSSEFAGKLSDRAGTSGHSQGGFAATSAGSHKNVQATVSVEGGGVPPAKVAFVCETGVNDSVRGPCTSSYTSAKGPSFLADHNDADHINTPTTLGASTDAGKEFVRIYTSWFRCFLADDSSACALFEGGKSAPLCDMGSWATCDGKNFP